MIKKLLLTVAVLTCTSFAHAAEKDNFSGGYIGVKLGCAQNIGKSSVGWVSEKGTEYGFEGTVLAGAGQVLDNGLYLGLEGFVNKDTSSFTDSKKIGNEILSAKGEYDIGFGVAGRIGFQVTPNSLFYVSMGVSAEKFDIKVGKGRISSQRELVFVPGIGAQFHLTQNLSARFDITHRLSKAFEFSAEHGQDKLKFSKTSVTLGLVYRF